MIERTIKIATGIAVHMMVALAIVRAIGIIGCSWWWIVSPFFGLLAFYVIFAIVGMGLAFFGKLPKCMEIQS